MSREPMGLIDVIAFIAFRVPYLGRLASIVALGLSSLVLPQSVLAQPVAPSGVAAAEAKLAVSAGTVQPLVEKQLVKVTIFTSRSEVTSEGGYGVFADLQNVDSAPLTLRTTDTMLVVQPELAGTPPCAAGLGGFYPTEGGPADAAEVVIQPMEHYVAFWNVSRPYLRSCLSEGTPSGDEPARRGIGRALQYLWEKLAFVPGNYTFVVVGKARRAGDVSLYHTYTDRVSLHVGITQIDAMLAAMFGGLLGYLVTALRPGGDFERLKPRGTASVGIGGWLVGTFRNTSVWLVVARNMFSAGLVSAVVTILLARIADTQFPVTVTVADFWGALTVGFIAFFAGNSLIDRIVGLASGAPKNPGRGTPGATPDEPVDSPPQAGPRSAGEDARKVAEGDGDPPLGDSERAHASEASAPLDEKRVEASV